MNSANQDFTTTILVDKPAREVFDAITNMRAWWSEGIQGETTRLNDEFVFEVPGVHTSRQKLTELVPGKKVVWEVVDSHMTFIKDKSEWTGTKLVFDIARQGDKTRLTFTHQGLVPSGECYDACAPAWTQYVQHSLLSLIATGKGDPNLEGRRITPIEASTAK